MFLSSNLTSRTVPSVTETADNNSKQPMCSKSISSSGRLHNFQQFHVMRAA